VAEAEVPVPPLVIELAQAQALVRPGQDVHAGVIVAQRKKLLGRGDELRAPVAGRVVKVTESEVLLQPPPLVSTLLAQLPGSVAAVRAGWGADVEGCFGILHGWGGMEGGEQGRLGEEIAISVEPLTIGQVQALASQGARAVVAPSWADDPAPSPWPDGERLPILLTERLPGRPMATPIAEALKRHLGRPAGLEGGPSPRLAFAGEAGEGSQCLGLGAWVRTADGHTGRLTTIGQRTRFFPSGMRAVPAEVDLGNRTETLALDSLEWIA